MIILFAVLSLAFFTISNLYFRIASQKVGSIDTLGMLYTTLAGIFSLPLLIFDGNLFIPTDPRALAIIPAVIGWAGFSYLSAWMAHHYEASVNAILGQITTVFSILLGIFLLKEQLTLPNFIGILLILLANILLSLKESGIVLNKVFYMRIGLSFLLALNFMFDNIASPFYNRGLYIFLAYFIPGILIWFIVPSVTVKSIKQTMKDHTLDLSILSFTSLCGYYFLLKAYDGGTFALVIPIIQSSTVSTVLAATYFLGEKKNLFLKLFTGILVTIGVIIIGLNS